MIPSDEHSSDVEGSSVVVATPYNHHRMRSDTWNRLRDAARRLRTSAPIRSDTKEYNDEAARLSRACVQAFESLELVEPYHAFPGMRLVGHLRELFEAQRYPALAALCIRVVRMLSTGSFRRLDLSSLRPMDTLDLLRRTDGAVDKVALTSDRPYFELLVVDDGSEEDAMIMREQFSRVRNESDRFQYELVFVPTFEDAVLAAILNPSIQACLVRFSFQFHGKSLHSITDRSLNLLGEDRESLAALMPGNRTQKLAEILRRLRPELDLYRVTSAPIEAVASDSFRRAFYQSEDFHDIHVSVLKGVDERFETPFFDALRRYSERPTGMFHALPLSRGRTITRSNWIEDFGDFYGKRLFLAETSATIGGLDSLLQPSGSLKQAQELAGRAFGADRTYFVTNGTSTANKIVMQALCRPGDIVLLSHDCHKSHPYATILSGASPVYLDAYPLIDYSMYGGVSIHEIKKQLLVLKRAGKLDQVRLLLLTNLTFDGITYDPYQVMQEVLAIKPDMLFLWDEAWFAYGRFSPVLRRRTAMDAATRLEKRFQTPEYRANYAKWKEQHDARDPNDDDTWLAHELLPDPETARVRVYATQSTHKTLTSLRQGSMIHVRDGEFERDIEASFHEAYMTHTSTSPNYQILASLDVGRRQVELEGYDMVTNSLELALTLRESINQNPKISRYFRALSPGEMVPEEFRASKIERYWDPDDGTGPIEKATISDEFFLDPTRVTLHVGRSGLDGDTFKRLLMDKHNIHINKTSRNTVLFLIHIGVSRGAIAHLLKVLGTIVDDIDRQARHATSTDIANFNAKVASLTTELPPLPNFSHFHRKFHPDPDSGTPEGNIRDAYFAAYTPEQCTYVPLDTALRDAVAKGREYVSAGFVTPYPPGFPVLVPGQVVSTEILDYLLALDVKEIHGFNPERGLRVFQDSVVAESSDTPAPKTKKTSSPTPAKKRGN